MNVLDKLIPPLCIPNKYHFICTFALLAEVLVLGSLSKTPGEIPLILGEEENYRLSDISGMDYLAQPSLSELSN